ncbi:MAG TPA: DUF2961 domain-containing protein [Candidatus Hydrogenedens sp.]|mgnify:CR=1 FL=1|nr:DUF2961 domain-containing protein [Candidatus Hydrogenedens sp.]HOL18814.1 DUF2961 domain-containing protein [Candidatus Hydrogenedens sp.]HPP59282.1 DUF2961 domain-containing protein [Candidatus Hydrogenedens sp.]
MKKNFILNTLFLFVLCFALGFTFSASVVAKTLAESLADEKDFTAHRISSYDRTGGNADGMQEQPIAIGETRTLAKIEGAGAITHIWVTISSKDPNHLKNLVLRMYWDGETNPSVESPIGDFFGLGHAQYYTYSSYPIQIGTSNALNCFWYMPFANGALVTITNEGTDVCGAFYYYVDYRQIGKVDTPLRFHAHYRQEYPCTEGTDYTFLEAKGRGHYVGVSLSIHNRADGWWGEGDDRFYVDGEEKPSLHGTGSEDYFCGAWCYGPAFSYLFFGCPLRGEHKRGEKWNVYRFHILDPVPFKESIRVTIEHGHANDRSDDFSSVAYWYQTEPHIPFEPLPAPEDRLPQSAPAQATHYEPGAIEIESGLLAFQNLDDTVVEQDLSGFGNEWSNGKQLWFKPEGPRNYVTTVDVPSDMAGDKKITLWYTKAPDYGKVELWLNSQKVAEWDGYNKDKVVRDSIQFKANVLAGQNKIELRIIGKNEQSTSYMAGLDCIKVE